MAQDPKKRQQKLQKKAAKRKSRQQDLARAASRLMAPSLRKAGEWPVHEVWFNTDWRDARALTQVIVSRLSPNGYFAVGNFLIDRSCLGVKNAFGKVMSEYDYHDFLRKLREHQDMVPGELNLAAKIVRDSIAYARQFGFQPNRDTPQAMLVLGDADPDLSPVEVTLGGSDGKPFFQAGPYDDVDRILAKLMKAVGPDGFTYLLPIDDPEFDDLVEFAPRDTIEFDDE